MKSGKNSIGLFFAIVLLFSLPNLIYAQKKINAASRPKVGLVLSGGGAKGFAYIGFLKVMREAGLRVDYIAGTSMGSIVAGLYAVGYSPEEIEKIVREQDWEAVLADEIPRELIAFSEKEYGGASIFTFPLVGGKVNMISSLAEGQEVDQLLNYYLSPAYKINDFEKLNIPFLCIGTDLLTGDEVEITKGYLPDAIRASMNIPGFFSPFLVDSIYMVDGGVINNYPAVNVKNKGIDIIIGADVQSGLKSDINELNSVPEVINQIIGYSRIDANEEGFKVTDYYYNIPMSQGMMDFTSYDEIIAIGEQIARDHFDELKHLADSLNAIEYKPIREQNAKPLEKIFVDDVIIVGNEKMPDIYFNHLKEEYSNKEINLLELKEQITEIYGTRFFTHISYKFKQENNKNNLYVYVTEADPGYLSLGVHYDFNYDGSILANITARNILGKRSKFFANIILGPNPRLKAMYFLSNSNSAGFGITADFYSFKFDDYNDGVKTGRMQFNNNAISLFGQKSFKNKFSLRAGVLYEYFQFKQDVVIDTTLIPYEKYTSYATAFVSVNLDSYNKLYFPTRGTKAELKAKYIIPWTNNDIKNLVQSSSVFYLKLNSAIPIADKLTAIPGLFTAITIKQDLLPPIQHWVGVGGLNPNNYVESHVPFMGVNFVQSWGFYTAIARLKLRYNVYDKLYLTASADGGVNSMDATAALKLEDAMLGYGLTASYNSFIGPVEFTVMGSNVNPKPSFFVNIGYWF